MNKSRSIALGGVFSALCLIIMFMTGLVPFASYAFPGIAGAMLIAVAIEVGTPFAVMSYVAVAVLSVFVVADREAAMMFIVFFGYYPIVKTKLEKIKPRGLELFTKGMLFNASVAGGYFVAVQLFGMAELMEGMGDFGVYSAAVFLALFNVVFWIYDFALTRYILIYSGHLRYRLLRR